VNLLQSLRSRLVLLVLAALTPGAILLTYSIHEATERSIDQARNSLMTLARVTATGTSRFLAANKESMELFARRPQVRLLDGRRCDPVISDFRDMFPSFANLTTITLDGTAVCSAVPQPGGKPVNIAKTEWFQRSIVEKRFLAGHPFVGPITGRWVSVLVSPIRDEHNAVTGFVGLPLDLKLFAPGIEGTQLSPGMRAGIVTNDGYLVWRSEDQEGLVGRYVGNVPVVRRIMETQNGNLDGTGTDGIHRLYAVAPIPETDWYAFVGLPSAPLYDKARNDARTIAFFGLLGLFAALVLALLLARRVADPISGISAAARAIKEGTDARAPIGGPREVKQLAADFNSLVDAWTALQEQSRQSQESVFQAQQVFRVLVENSPDIIARYDRDCRRTYVNPAYLKEAQIPREQLIANSPLQRSPLPAAGAAALEDLLRRVLDSGLPEAIDVSWPGEQGTGRWFNIYAFPELDQDGRIVSVMTVSRNISARKVAEEEVRRLNQELEQRVTERTAQLQAANKELEAFAYSVSHDLRAPLRHIGGFVALLEDKLGASADEDTRHFMTTITAAAQQMATLIDDLLSFSRMGRQDMASARVDLGALVRDIVDEIKAGAPQRKIDWRIGELPVVTGDRAMLRIALVNLIANAVKFTQKKAEAQIEIGSRTEAGEVVIFVRDNGVGFDMKQAEKLFGVFQRLHAASDFEGTGIGLANVRRVVSRHGGRTWAEGRVDEGATFSFSLPLTEGGIVGCTAS
jgi:PAS domain S-box-containing protein